MLSIETEIPVAVHAAANAEADSTAALQFLRSLNLLALGTRTDGGDAQHQESGHDLARLEAKIDMLVAMVGSLVAAGSRLPPRCRVSLSAESLEVSLATTVAAGAAVVVEMYPERGIAPGIVAAGNCQPGPHGYRRQTGTDAQFRAVGSVGE